MSEIVKRQPRRTWSMFGDVTRKPTPYEVVTGKFHTHFRREPAPFELDPEMPANVWYLTYREGSPFQVDDWESFRDPHRLTYKDYVALQHDREIYIDALVDRHETEAFTSELDPAWIETLGEAFVPLRFPLHILQMLSLYVGQMAPSSYITNCAHFQAADEMRRVQRIAYWTKVLANLGNDEFATTDFARERWEEGAQWQPLREAMELALATYDWGEAFVAVNLAIKPVMDGLVNDQLGALAKRNGDHFVAALGAEFARDSRRSQEWSSALTTYALDREESLGPVLEKWLGVWRPRAEAAGEALVPLLSTAPAAIAHEQIVSGIRETHDELIAATAI